MVSVNTLFKPYCLPNRYTDNPGATKPMIKEQFDASQTLTTPKPDFVYGLREAILPQALPDVPISLEVRRLLDVAPTTRETFFF